MSARTMLLGIGEAMFNGRFSRRFIIIRLVRALLVIELIKRWRVGGLGQGSSVIAFARCLYLFI